MRWFWLVVAAAAVVLALVADLRFLVALAAAVVIFRLGMAVLGNMRAGAAEATPTPPEPITDPSERTIYHCEECGAEVLLLVRGEEAAPRHCGERMKSRVEIPRD